MKTWLKAAVTLALLGLILWIVPLDELWARARDLDPRIWFASLAAVCGAHVIAAQKWRATVNVGKARLRPLDAVQCHFAGMFANLFLPSIIGGDALRAGLAGRITRRFEAVIFGSLADRLIDVIALGLLSVGGAILSHRVMSAEVGNWMAVWGGLGAVALVVGLLVLRLPTSRWPRRVRRPLRRGMVAARRLARRPGTALSVLALALAIQGCFVLLNAWLGAAIGIEIPLVAWFFAWPTAKLISLAPVSIAGFGVRESALAGILLTVGVEFEQGMLVSLIWATMLVGSSLVGGAVWFLLGLRPQARTGAGHGSLLSAAERPESVHG